MIKKNTYFSKEQELERSEKIEKKNQKRRRNIVRTGQEPLLPFVIQGLFWMTAGAIPVVWILEVVVTLQGKREAGLAAFFERSSCSVFYAWLILGGMTVVLCAVQLLRVYYFNYEEKIYKFAEEIPAGEFARYSVVNPEQEDKTLLLYAREADPSAEKKYKAMIQKMILVGAGAVLYCLIGFVL